MKNKELIEKLSKLPQDLDVCFEGMYKNMFQGIETVELDELNTDLQRSSFLDEKKKLAILIL